MRLVCLRDGRLIMSFQYRTSDLESAIFTHYRTSDNQFPKSESDHEQKFSIQN